MDSNLCVIDYAYKVKMAKVKRGKLEREGNEQILGNALVLGTTV
jgi:hypothetical protein